MKANEVIIPKSYDFALKVVQLYKYLSEERKESVLSGQFLKSGTGIGVNIQEVLGADSKKDFSTKLDTAYKASRGTKYWLRLLHDNKYIKKSQFEELFHDCDELSELLSEMLNSRKYLAVSS